MSEEYILHLLCSMEMNNQSDCLLHNNASVCASDSNVNGNSLFTTIFSILLVIVMSIGVIGNLLVIYVVLNYGRLKTVTNTYLLHLALSDLIFLSGIPFFASSIIVRGWVFGGILCKLFFLTQGVNQYTSIIILALLAFDRYLAVCYSSKSIIWRSQVNPNLLLILAWIFSFILMLPILTFTKIQGIDAYKVQCTIIFPYLESLLLYFIFVIYTSMMTFVLPLSLMTFFYIRIVCRLKHRVSQQHRRSHSSTRTRRKVSILVLTVIAVHILCCSPYWAFQILTTAELLSQNNHILVQLSSITQFLLFVNSSTNPILYAFLSGVFRLSFKHVFYCCLSTNDGQYLHAKAVGKRNLSTSPNRNTLSNVKRDQLSMKTIPSNLHYPISCESSINKQNGLLLNTRTHLSLTHDQTPHLSLVPIGSILTSDASCISDL